MAASDGKKSVLFICLGNICRSPIAEAVFQKMVDDKGLQDKWYVDSAAIGAYHIGNPPDPRARQCLKNHDVKCTHRCRQITKSDFNKFDVIFGMDHENMDDLNSLKPKNATAKLEMLGEYDPQKVLIIEDPYYGDDFNDFETVYEQCVRCCAAFLEANQ